MLPYGYLSDLPESFKYALAIWFFCHLSVSNGSCAISVPGGGLKPEESKEAESQVTVQSLVGHPELDKLTCPDTGCSNTV